MSGVCRLQSFPQIPLIVHPTHAPHTGDVSERRTPSTEIYRYPDIRYE